MRGSISDPTLVQNLVKTREPKDRKGGPERCECGVWARSSLTVDYASFSKSLLAWTQLTFRPYAVQRWSRYGSECGGTWALRVHRVAADHGAVVHGSSKEGSYLRLIDFCITQL